MKPHGTATTTASGGGAAALPARCLRCAALLLPWLARLFLADVLLSLLLPLSALWPDACHAWSSRLAAHIWRGIQRLFTARNRARIVVSGAAQLQPGESAIVVANHAAWADFYMVQEVAEHAGMLPSTCWFAKSTLKWIPFLGWGLWAMDMCLVSRDWTHDKKEMARVFRGVVQREWPIWLVAYSEGSRYTARKRLEAEAWSRAHKTPLGKHLLIPRTKGFIACVKNLRKTQHVTAVYDLTIAYADSEGNFQAPPSFVETISRPDLDQRWRFFVHVDRHPLNTLPDGDEELAQWLQHQWVEKGERLTRLKKMLEAGLPWEDSSLSSLPLI
ncbi:hypothetical protein LTR53_006727 [Teratosphaeriaceae sp. CCFEE 6253]|nr:hypothetical protein LTR53_006727 [Teratosphaeriaceae sp. CCFEE 6253]